MIDRRLALVRNQVPSIGARRRVSFRNAIQVLLLLNRAMQTARCRLHKDRAGESNPERAPLPRDAPPSAHPDRGHALPMPGLTAGCLGAELLGPKFLWIYLEGVERAIWLDIQI